jgi:regulator of sigma E protease
MSPGLIILALVLATIVYYVGYFAVAILFRTHNKHYFLGFGKSLFEFSAGGVIFTVGIFIPIFGLAQFYKVEGYARMRADDPWQFASRPWMSRLFATYGGVTALLVAALAIMTVVKLIYPEQYISREEINKYGVYPSPLAESYGFERKDKILTINGQAFESYYDLLDREIYQTPGNTFKIERNGKSMIVHVPEGDHDLSPGQNFLDIMTPIEIDSVLQDSPAEQMNLQEGDRIIEVNGRSTNRVGDMRAEFDHDADGSVNIIVQRINNADTVNVASTVVLDSNHNLGILTRAPLHYTIRQNNIIEAARKGAIITFDFVRSQLVSELAILKGRKNDVGPITIRTAFAHAHWWERLGYLIANFAALGIVWNFCPYPRSAFWEVIALAYEGITRRKYPYARFHASRKLGWIIFCGLILFRFVMDVMMLF